ncbi:unnamed protein product [Urochloa humidicola]
MAEGLIGPVLEMVVSRTFDELIQRAYRRWTSATLTCDGPRKKKFKIEIPDGSFRFEHEGKLNMMFDDLVNPSGDHRGASAGTSHGTPTPHVYGDVEDEGARDDEGEDEDSDSDQEATPARGKGKRARCVEKGKGKMSEASGRECQMDRRRARREDDSEFSIKTVMALVKECGATPGTKEFFVASEIFTKRSEREMFMTLDTPQERYEWLKMKEAKYYP